MSNDEDLHSIPESEQASTDAAEAIDRREAMSRMGKYAAYTAPTMLTILMADKAGAQAQDPGSPPPPPGGGG